MYDNPLAKCVHVCLVHMLQGALFNYVDPVQDEEHEAVNCPAGTRGCVTRWQLALKVRHRQSSMETEENMARYDV